jgi:hypothetical protein
VSGPFECKYLTGSYTGGNSFSPSAENAIKNPRLTGANFLVFMVFFRKTLNFLNAEKNNSFV